MPNTANRNLYLTVGGDVSDLSVAMKAGRTALLGLGDAAIDVQGEVNKALAQIGANAPSVARQVEQNMRRTFAAIGRNAQAALAAPTPQGKLDIINASGARADADAATAQAAQLRLLADASEAVAARQGEAGKQARVFAVAMELQAQDAARNAQALGIQADVLEQVAAEAGLASLANDVHARSQRGLGVAGMEAEHVVRSLSDSIAAGQSPTRALTLEMGRITEALQFFALQSNATEGAMGKFAAFMGGGWGLAISVGVGVLATLVSKLDEGADAAEKKKTAIEDLTDAVQKLDAATGRANVTTERQIALDAAAARQAYARAIAERQVLAAQLGQALALANGSQGVDNPFEGPNLAAEGVKSIEQGKAAALQKQLDENGKAIANAQESLRGVGMAAILQGVTDQTDKAAAATHRYAMALQSLKDRFLAGKLPGPEFRGDVLDITARRDAELAAARDHGGHTRAGRADHGADRTRTAWLNSDIGFTDEALKLRKAFLDAAEKTEADATLRDSLAREEINAEADAEQRLIADRYGKGAYGAPGTAAAQADRDNLLQLNEQVRNRKLQNVDIARRSLQVNRQAEMAGIGLEGQAELLRLEAALATTTDDRRRIALEQLALDEAKLRTDQQRILDDPKSTQEQRDAAKLRLGQIDAEHPLRVKQINTDNASPGDRYVARLKASVGDLHADFQNLGVDAIEHLGDGFENAASKALKLHGVLGQIADDFLKMFVEREIEGPLAGLLFPAHAGGGLIQAHAAGGMIRGPGGREATASCRGFPPESSSSTPQRRSGACRS